MDDRLSVNKDGIQLTQSRRPSEEERSRLWKAAIKVPMYTVALTPILVGSAASFSVTGCIHLPTLISFLLIAICLIAWINVTNDAYDFDMGIDGNKVESVVNLLGGTRRARNRTLLFGNLFLIPTLTLLYNISTYPASQPLDPTVLTIIAVSALLGYSYQGPPFRLGYLGLGEPICFVVWFISTIAAYHSQSRLFQHTSSSPSPSKASLFAPLIHLFTTTLFDPTNHLLPAALLVALPTTIILFCSHFHQEKDDRAVGKLSPIVRLGVKQASDVLFFSVVALYVIQILAWIGGWLPTIPTLSGIATVPLARSLVVFVHKNHGMPQRVRPAKYFAVRLHFFHGITLAGGLLLSYYYS